MNITIGFLAFLLVLTACGKNSLDKDPQNIIDKTSLSNGKTTWWQPATGISFDWELNDINSGATFSGEVIDVDAFTTTAETVAALHAKGEKVIAYMSAGTIENDRPDISLLPLEVVGKVYPEWPNEKWLDIRQLEKMKPWLNTRFNMILKKGFDGVEPDNMDSYSNETGFSIQIADTKKYADYLIGLAHTNGLSIGQKNVPELSEEYASKFDWALTEDAFKQGWQDSMAVYVKKNKPVFAVEYTDKTTQQDFQNLVCPKAKLLEFTAILKKRDLDKWVYKCK